MKIFKVDDVVEKLMDAAVPLSELLADTAKQWPLGMYLSGADLMISTGIREVHQGRRAGRSDITILGNIRGFNRVAVGNLRAMAARKDAIPYASRLTKLATQIHDTAEEPVAEEVAA